MNISVIVIWYPLNQSVRNLIKTNSETTLNNIEVILALAKVFFTLERIIPRIIKKEIEKPSVSTLCTNIFPFHWRVPLQHSSERKCYTFRFEVVAKLLRISLENYIQK